MILDGELVCIGRDGRPVFQQLRYRGAKPYFYAFDLLWLNGEDFRQRSLMERKAALRKILPAQPSWILYADHTDGKGKDLFRAACRMDLEGIVAKWKHGPYLEGERQTNWVKIQNPVYSQMQGRQEQFAKLRQLWLRPAASIGQTAGLQRKPVVRPAAAP